MITITLPDGAKRQYKAGITAFDIASSISEGLARNVLAATVNGDVVDVNRPIHSDASLQLHTWRDKEGKATFWHSSAHLMAEAIAIGELRAILPASFLAASNNSS